MELIGKVVLVTGAQQGIGAALAREFAKAGADVAINWLDDEGTAQYVADEVCAHGRRAILVRADVGRLEQVRKWCRPQSKGSAQPISWSTMPGCFHACRSSK